MFGKRVAIKTCCWVTFYGTLGLLCQHLFIETKLSHLTSLKINLRNNFTAK